MPRQFYARAGVTFTNKQVNDDDDWIEIRVLEANIVHNGKNDDNPTKGEIVCDVVKLTNPAAPQELMSETFVGGFRQTRGKVIFTFRDKFYKIHQFRLIIAMHKAKPGKDQIIFRSADGIDGLLKCLGNPDGSNSGTATDPDAESFTRSGNQAGPVPITGSTTTGPQTGGIQPGSVIVSLTAPTVKTLYDFNGQLFEGGFPTIVQGSVDYGPGITNTWTVTLNVASTGSVFAMRV